MATSSTIVNHGRRIEGGISINASGAQINAQGDVLSHNTIQVLPTPALTAKEKERNLARLQRCPLPSVIFTGREEALRKICDRLSEPSDRTRIFVLYGLGGAGKFPVRTYTLLRKGRQCRTKDPYRALRRRFDEANHRAQSHQHYCNDRGRRVRGGRPALSTTWFTMQIIRNRSGKTMKIGTTIR